MLQVWGLRITGASLKNPLHLATGGSSGYDEDWEATCYVQRVPGYERAYPVLVHVHAEFQPVEIFRVCEPGETLMRALLRREWGDLIGTPRHLVGRAIYGEFRLRLSALAHDPATWFVPRPPMPEEIF